MAPNHVLRAGRLRSQCQHALCYAADELLSVHVHHSSGGQSLQGLGEWERVGRRDHLKSDIVC
jgi:hypothetical protein